MLVREPFPMSSTTSRPIIRSLIWDIVLNATVPVAIYLLAKSFAAASELSALLWATGFPLLSTVQSLAKRRGVDPVAVLILLGLLTSMIALLLSDNAQLLLIRE